MAFKSAFAPVYNLLCYLMVIIFNNHAKNYVCRGLG